MRDGCSYSFTGTAGTGDIIGAKLAVGVRRGENRGLFSKEAGQGSARIAHASAKANEPLSEGMVAILEPFIDTIIICLVTGLVLLSSGVWSEKHNNQFEYAEIEILNDSYKESNPDNSKTIYDHLNGIKALPV